MRNATDPPVQPTETPKAKLVVDIATICLALAEADYNPLNDAGKVAVWNQIEAIYQTGEQFIKNHAVVDLATDTEHLTDAEKAWVVDTLAKQTKLPGHIALRFAQHMVLPLLKAVADAVEAKEIALAAMNEGVYFKGAQPTSAPAVEATPVVPEQESETPASATGQ